MGRKLYGGADADARSDQLRFCVAMVTALHGERPFAGDTLDAMDAAPPEVRPVIELARSPHTRSPGCRRTGMRGARTFRRSSAG